jgi:hypothetical protein
VAGLVAGSLTLGSFPAWAGTNSPGIDRREYNQQNRLYQGVDSGRVTPRENFLLQREQARINAAEARMKADGQLTRRERARLHSRLDASRRHIYRAKHNGRVR